MQLKYYKSLDGVRGLAAIMVLVFHFFQHLQLNSTFLKIVQKASVFGQTGVDLFFVLSGFLITRILLYSKESDNQFFLNFYWKRTLRIFPLYFFFLLIFYYAAPYFGVLQFSDFAKQIYHYTFLQNAANNF